MSYTLIQTAKIPGQFDVQIGFTVSAYVVTYGTQVVRFHRSVEGFQGAVREFEECVAHAWNCAAPSDEELAQEGPTTRQFQMIEPPEPGFAVSIYTADIHTGRCVLSWEGMDGEARPSTMTLRELVLMVNMGQAKELK